MIFVLFMLYIYTSYMSAIEKTPTLTDMESVYESSTCMKFKMTQTNNLKTLMQQMNIFFATTLVPVMFVHIFLMPKN